MMYMIETDGENVFQSQVLIPYDFRVAGLKVKISKK